MKATAVLRRALTFLTVPLFLLVAAVEPASAWQQVLFEVGGSQPGDQLGRAVSKAGDVNGDGFADFIAGGSPSDRNGTNGILSNRGLVQVYSGLDAQILYTYVGNHDDASLGKSISDAGDVNADGYADFVMGAWGEDAIVGGWGGGLKHAAGTADVRSGLDGSRLILFNGTKDGDGVGWHLSGAGDVNSDGFPDLAIGSLEGTVWILSGLNGKVLRKYSDDPQFGWAVSGAGDFDADGYDDIVGGAGYLIDRGIVRVFSGRTGQEIFRDVGPTDYFDLGQSVSDAGDVDGDGFGDVIAGAEGYYGAGGAARVYSGRLTAMIYEFDGWVLPATDVGHSVASAGDIDNDGHDDLICGGPATQRLGDGRAWVFSGSDGSELFVLDGVNGVRYFGESVDGGGDVDGDGFADVIAGSGPTSFDAPSGGYVLVATGDECGSIRSYPSECTGTGGFAPELTLTGCLVAGKPLELALAQGPGGAQAALLLSTQTAPAVFPSGCTIHTGFPAVVIPLGLLSGSGPGEGSWSTSETVPALPGTTFYVAAVMQDGAHRLVSNTLEAEIAP